MWGVYALPGLKLWPPDGGHATIMTTYQENASTPLPLHDGPLPEMKAKASELYYMVKGSEQEKEYRRIALKHPDKDHSREKYEHFLEEIEAMFAVPTSVPSQLAAGVQREAAPDVDLLPALAAPSEPDAEEVGEEDPEAQEGLEGDDSGNSLGGLDEELPIGDTSISEASDGDEADTDEPGGEDADPETPGEADAGTDEPDGDDPAPAAPVLATSAASAPVPATSSGLLAQLAGMLADGGQLTLQLMRVGDQLTVGILPKPHPGEQGPQALIVTNTPEWLDHHLVSAMQPYAQARQDAFSVCAAAATRQQAANKKAAAAPASKTPTPASKPGPKTFKLTLTAEEGTTLTARQDGKDVPISLGENTIKQGNLEVIGTHDLFGEVKKTFAMYADKTYDLREQQGGRVTVKVTPDTAALTAVQGERRIPFHAETLLPAGSWTIEAEAAEHDTAMQKIHVKAGKPQEVELALKLREMGSLF